MARTTARAPLHALGLGLALAALSGCGSGTGSGTRLLAIPAGASTGGNVVTQTARVQAPFRTIVRGETSLITTPGARLAVNDPQWDALWQDHAGPSRAPAVAFPSEVAIGAFAGPARGPEARMEVLRVDRDPATGDLHATTRLFEKGAWRAPTTTAAPYHLVAVPAQAGAARPRVTTETELLLDIETLDAGAHSQIGAQDPTYQGELFLLQDQASLVSFWALHEPGATPPAVDFASEQVVVIHAGFIGRFGNSVEVRRAVYDPSSREIRLDWVVNPYRGGAAPPQIDETPFAALRLPKAPARAVREELRSPLVVSATAGGDQSLWTGTFDVQVARDQAAFDAIVTARLGAGGYTGRAIDFSREQAVLAFYGQATSGGHGIEVARAAMLERGELEVTVETHHPTGMATSVMTSPFAIAAVPRTFGPHAVRVEDTTPRP